MKQPTIPTLRMAQLSYGSGEGGSAAVFSMGCTAQDEFGAWPPRALFGML